MKTPIAFLSLALFLTLANKTGAVPFVDEFNGTSINSALWSEYHPFSDSSAVESGGVLTIQNHGGLVSQTGFSGPIEITGRFAFTGNEHDKFMFAIRTDGVPGYNALFNNGIRFGWDKRSDSGQVWNVVFINRIVDGFPPNDVTIAEGTFDFAFNQFYNFRITDDGTHIALYFDDLVTPLLTATDSTQMGNKIGFYNREGAGNGSSISAGSEVKIDFLRVNETSAVPDAASNTLFLAVVSIGALAVTKHRTQTVS